MKEDQGRDLDQVKVKDEVESSGTFIGTVSNNEGLPHREICVTATDRRDAVRQILRIFWKEELGDAKKTLVISDPGEEVQYDPEMKCTDVLYNYLSEDLVKRVLENSDGVIGRDPKFPNSRCQLIRLEKRDYKNLPTRGKTKESETPKTLESLRIFKKLAPPPSVDVWKTSKIHNPPTSPTRTTKEVFRSKDCDGRAKPLGMHFRDIFVQNS
jgi:hypothetical protein